MASGPLLPELRPSEWIEAAVAIGGVAVSLYKKAPVVAVAAGTAAAAAAAWGGWKLFQRMREMDDVPHLGPSETEGGPDGLPHRAPLGPPDAMDSRTVWE